MSRGIATGDGSERFRAAGAELADISGEPQRADLVTADHRVGERCSKACYTVCPWLFAIERRITRRCGTLAARNAHSVAFDSRRLHDPFSIISCSYNDR